MAALGASVWWRGVAGEFTSTMPGNAVSGQNSSHLPFQRSCLRSPGPCCKALTTRAVAASGKGFGAKKEKALKLQSASPRSGEKVEEERAVSKILKKLEAEKTTAGDMSESRSGRKSEGEVQEGSSKKKGMVNIIDPREAARGRVDYVRVEGWEPRGKGEGGEAGERAEAEMEDLGNLPVRSFSQGAALLKGDASENSHHKGQDRQDRDRIDQAEGQDALFYEQLVRHLQLLDSKGELAVARPKNAVPLPPFEKWSFGDKRFLQYLVDLLSVHLAIEDAVQLTTSQRPGSDFDDVGSSPSPLGLFGPSLGLNRSAALLQDIQGIRNALRPEKKADNSVFLDKPTTQAVAYAAYVGSITNGLARDSPIERIKSASQRKPALSPSRKAELRIFANLYSLYVANLTTGMRIGSKAMECVPSMRVARAVRFFREYPDHVKDPLKVFIDAVNASGRSLSESDKDVVLEELPKAVVKTSLLLSVLAVEAPVTSNT